MCHENPIRVFSVKIKKGEVDKMRPIKLIGLEDEEEIFKERVFTDDDINLLKQLKIGRFMQV